MISGWRWSPDRACSTIAEMGGYIGQVRSRPVLVRGPVPADRALVVQRPRRVDAADPGGGGLVVRAEPGLVAERPGEDRRVVPVAQHHARDPADPLVDVARVVAQRALERVRLDVGFVDDVEPELVGQVEEDRVVRVVRRADGVEPEPLHLDEVGPHRGVRDDASGVLVEVVAIHAADEDALAVEQQVDAADVDAPEPDAHDMPLDHRAVRRAQRDHEIAERGRLGRPARHVGDLEVPVDPARAGAAPGGGTRRPRRPDPRGRRRRPPGRRRCGAGRWPGTATPGGPGGSYAALTAGSRPAISASTIHPAVGGDAREPDVDRQVERARGQVVGEAADRRDVGHVHGLRRVQVHRAGDAAVPPLVLVLDVRRVGPLHDRQPQVVRLRQDEGRDVELRREMGVLADPDVAPVDLDEQDALGGADVQDDAPADPVLGQLEGPFVDPGRVRPPGSPAAGPGTASRRSCSGAGPRSPGGSSSRGPRCRASRWRPVAARVGGAAGTATCRRGRGGRRGGRHAWAVARCPSVQGWSTLGSRGGLSHGRAVRDARTARRRARRGARRGAGTRPSRRPRPATRGRPRSRRPRSARRSRRAGRR